MISTRRTPFVLLVPTLLLTWCSAAAAGFVLDGNLDDWNVTVADGDASVFPGSNPGIGMGFQYLFFEEDQPDGNGDGGSLGPNVGGQNYDVEFLGVAQIGDDYIISIVTGQRFDNESTGNKWRYSPGDIRLGTSAGEFGIEVGGATSGQIDGGGGDLGATFRLDGSGFTVASSPYLDTSPLQTAGSVWSNTTWELDPFAPQHRVQLLGGDYAGQADFIYTNGVGPVDGYQHAVIEVRIAKSVLGNAELQSVYWAPSCGNDVGEIHIPQGGLPTPEPGSMTLLTMGGLTLLGCGLRRRRKTDKTETSA